MLATTWREYSAYHRLGQPKIPVSTASNVAAFRAHLNTGTDVLGRTGLILLSDSLSLAAGEKPDSTAFSHIINELLTHEGGTDVPVTPFTNAGYAAVRAALVEHNMPLFEPPEDSSHIQINTIGWVAASLLTVMEAQQRA